LARAVDQLTAPDPRRWSPIRLMWSDAEPILEWCVTENLEFSDPFFDETITRCLRLPFNQLFRRRTSLAAADPRLLCLPPAGFIFHVSRCGSSLLAQACADTEAVLKLAEPAALDSVSRADLRQPVRRELQLDWVRATYAALAQPRPAQRSAIVKFDAWTVHRLDLILDAFPDVPWAFVCRDPVEVVVSHLRRRGAHTVPGTLPWHLLRVDAGWAATVPAEDYIALVTGRLMEAAVARADEQRALVIDYSQLHDGGVDAVLQHFGLTHSVRPSTLTSDAKNPTQRFEPDADLKRAAAGPDVIGATERHAAAAYANLLALTNRVTKC